MLRARCLSVAAAMASLVALTPTAHAANVLFVADGESDTGIGIALSADGHTVTTRTMDLTEAGANTSFASAGALEEYDIVFWSVSGAYYEHSAATFTTLDAYVRSGGRVLVTGYDGTLGETGLVAFLGATSSRDQVGTAPGAIAAMDTSLTTGVADIRGVVPAGGYTDKDCISGLMADTTLLVASGGDTTCAQWSIRRIGDGEIAWVSNGSYSGSDPSWEVRAAGATGAYNAAIRNFAAAADTASREPGSPLIEFDRVYSADEGAALALMVTVTDEEGDPVTFSWDTDDDGTFGELAGMRTFTLAAGSTDGDDSLRVRVQASDGTHTSERTRTLRITNVAPRITSVPPTGTSVGENLRYEIAVDDPGGALDPLAYRIIRGPDGASITTDGTFVWIPTDLEVTLPSERTTIEISVDDGDGGSATQTWEMFVSPNRAPDGMTLLYPANGIVIADSAPRLVVGNGADPDPLDTLRYFFQLDDEPSFEAPLLVESGEVAQGTGYTALELAEPLPPGQYFWRAWMYDGAAMTEPETTSFTLVPDPNVDGGVVALDGAIEEIDAGTIREPDPTPRSGCACAAPGASGNGATLGLALAALALARRRRR